MFKDETGVKFYYRKQADDDWVAANKVCQSLSGHLPIIHSKAKQKYLQSLYSTNVWIGLRTDNYMYIKQTIIIFKYFLNGSC